MKIILKSKEASKLNEEYADCLMKIMKAIQDDIDDDDSEDSDEEETKQKMIENIRMSLKGEPMTHIKVLSVRNPDSIGISNKARFTFLDIYEGINKF